MTENQLNKLKNRLLNIQTQLGGASVILEKTDPFMNSKVQEANKLVSEVFEMCSKIKTQEVVNEPSKKKTRYKTVTHEVIIARHEPATYNLRCRNYSETRSTDGKLIERTCVVGMDMCYCSKNCAYATNNVCSLKADSSTLRNRF